MIPTNQLKQFYQVAKMGSIRKAARYLNKSQSAVSSAIKTLEDELGCQLLKRSSNSTQLTEKGHKLYKFAEGFVEASDLLRSDLQWNSIPKKIINFGVNKHYDELCAPLLSRFISKFDDIEMKIHFTDGAFLRKEFQNGQLDAILGINFNLAGIASDELPDDSIFVMNDTIRLVCSKEHPLAEKTDLKVDDLRDYSFILPSFYEDPVKQLFYENGMHLKLRATMNSGKLSAYLVQNTDCLGLLAPGTIAEPSKSYLAFPVFNALDLSFKIIMRFRAHDGLEGIALQRFKSVAQDWVNESCFSV
tara:strand:+ start:6688 stop:7596 length:909 start_codon:yes stop_codon:yes gene_type:complete